MLPSARSASEEILGSMGQELIYCDLLVGVVVGGVLTGGGEVYPVY